MTKQLRVTVDGKTYDVTVEVLSDDDTPSRLAAAVPVAAPQLAIPVAAPIPKRPGGSSPNASSGALKGDVVSPLAGTVVEVHVIKGQTVGEGETLVTLEAMKMNTAVSSPFGGTVQEVRVQAGAVVGEGAVLVSIQ